MAALGSRWPTTARPPVPLFSCDSPPPTSGTRTSPGRTPPDFGKSDGSGLYGYTHAAVTNPVLGVWSSVIENVVLPNFVIFGWFTFITETCLAIFLFLGLATRFWALVGVAQSFAIYLTVGDLPAEWNGATSSWPPLTWPCSDSRPAASSASASTRRCVPA